jgi:GNAT superfamily N-acetyltransferase
MVHRNRTCDRGRTVCARQDCGSHADYKIIEHYWSHRHECRPTSEPQGAIVLTGIVSLQLPRDRRALEVHFAALESEDLRFRFCGSIKPAALEQYLDQLAGPDVASFGIFDPERVLIAVCQLAQSGADLEVGVSVLSAFRRQGFAKALLEHSAARARVRGLRTLLIHTLMDNTPMLSLARGLGMSVEMLNGEADGRLRLRADPCMAAGPTAVSLNRGPPACSPLPAA